MLSRNQLTELPTTIGLLTNLRAVNLDENEISYLPPDVCEALKNPPVILRMNQKFQKLFIRSGAVI